MSSQLVCVEDYEEKAKQIIDERALEYYRSGAGEEYSLKLNREAYKRIRILPRFLRDISNLKVEYEIFGEKLKWPFGIAPTALQKLAHPEGEVANAKAAGNAGCIYILPTLSTSSIEEVARNAPNTHKWFQLYLYRDKQMTEKLIRRVENANFKAIVLTIDSPRFGIRRSDVRNRFEPPSHIKLANFIGTEAENVTCETEGSSGMHEYVLNLFDLKVTWKTVEWLISFTKLPVILKGVLTPEDAMLAYQYGCKGIIVSNHGARQLDGVPATIEVLPKIAEAVSDKILVMMDSGVRQGTDVFKAMALGAKIVFMGRSALWGLAVNGQQGVESVLTIIRDEFELTMQLAGCASLKDITKNMVVHESYFSKL